MTGSDVRSILHVDMDAFFVAVELLDHPELRGQPVLVGGSGPRGVVAAASYEARAYGVHSAMASSVARRRCPHAVFLDGRHGRYREVSAQVMAVFESVTPLVEPLSLDEAFLDVTGRTRTLGDAVSIAHMIRARVADEVNLTCSVGVASNKFLAKMATETAKPIATRQGPVPGLGVAEVRPGGVEQFLAPLAASALWGVGPATMAKLQRIGVRTIGDLAELSVGELQLAVGAAAGEHLHRLSHGVDDRPVEPHRAARSISHEETFATDLVDRGRLNRELLRLADAVADRLRDAELFARTVQIKVRFATFETISRSVTSLEGVADRDGVYRAARTLLESVEVAPGVRLLGVGVAGLEPADSRSVQLSLLDAAPADELHRAVDEIRERFGRNAIGPAALASPTNGVDTFAPGEAQWGPRQSTSTDGPGE